MLSKKLLKFRKFVSFLLTFSLLVNSLFAPSLAIAQETTPEPTPATEEVEEIQEEVPQETTESTPSVETTLEPEATDPAAEEQVIEVAETSEPTPTVTVTASPSPDEEINEEAEVEAISTTNEEATIESPLPETDLDEQVESSSATLTSSVTTDKADYAPDEKVLITANGLQPEEVYLLKISSSDPPPVTHEANITADSTGTATYLYQLDGNYRPDYLVEILLDGVVVTSTTFTDSHGGGNPSIDLDQCANGGIGDPPVTCSGSAWQNGNLNSNQAHYLEGDSVPYRSVMDDLTGGATYTVEIEWDTTKDSKHAIDYLTSFDRTETTADPCSDVVGVPNCADTDIELIPADTFMQSDGNWSGTQIAGNFTIYNGNITGLSSYTLPANYTGDTSTSITVTFTANTDGDAVLAWGGHIADRADWGVDNSAIAISGSPYHMRLNDFTCSNHDQCSVGSQDRSLSAGAVVFPASITVIKQADPEGSTSFPFTGTLGNFNLVDDGTNANTIVFDEIADFDTTYDVTETLPAGWALESITCDGGSTQTSIATATANISVAEGDSVTCTFTNTLQTGSITVNKETLPEGDQTSFDFDLGGVATGSTSLADDGSHTFDNLLPGDYTLTETEREGWDLTSATCTGGDDTDPSSISLDPDEHLTCTFTNTQRGDIKVIKNTVGGDGSFDFTSLALGDFTLSTVSNTDSIEFLDLLPGNYDVSEDIPDGWELSDISCTSSINDTEIAGSLELDPGEVIECVFTNTKLPTITVIKLLDPEDDGGLFDLLVDGIEVTTNVSHNGSGTATVSVGVHTVSELAGDNTDLGNYDKEIGGDCNSRGNITVAAGDEATCTITNILKRGSIFGYKYEDLDGDSNTDEYLSNPVENWIIELWEWITDTFVFTGLTATTDSSGYFEFTDLLPGIYQLREQVQTGWTNLTDTSVDVVVEPGENDGENNFVNTRFVSITAHKDVDTDGNGVVDESDVDSWTWDIADGSQNVTTGTTVDNLLPDTYTISEDQQNGYHVVSLICNVNGGSDVNHGAVESQGIALQSGDSLDCTFTNSRDTGDISGHKYNDVNGNGVVPEDGELGLEGWTIELYQGGRLPIATTTTDNTGYYEFTGLPTGDYKICEVLQNGWVQTYPNDCHNVTLDESGLTREFGNQGRGTVTVNKDIDTDNDGQADETNTGGWTYDLDGSGDFDMGSTQDVAAGTYILTEDDQDGYHFVSLVCYDGVNQNSNTTDLEVAPGQDVVCTYRNARDTGSILVTKIIDVDGDTQTTDDQTLGESWQFDVDGWSGDTTDAPADITDASGLAEFTSLKTGDYTIIETTQDGYDLVDAFCDNDGWNFDGQDSVDQVAVSTDSQTTCTFVNSPNGSIHGFKWEDQNTNGEFDGREDRLGNWRIFIDENDNQTWDDGEQYQLTNNSDNLGWYEFTNLFPGTYTVCEELQDGWVQTYPDTICQTVELPDDGESTYNFGNVQLGEVIVIKYEDKNGNGEFDPPHEGVLSGWTMNLEGGGYSESGETDGDGKTIFEDLIPGGYILSEIQKENWLLTNISCGEDEQGGGGRGDENIDLQVLETDEARVGVRGGETVTCYVGNQGRGTIEVIKDVVPDDGGASQWIIGGDTGIHILGDGDSTGPINVPVGTIGFKEAPAPGTNGDLYVSSYSCEITDGEEVTTESGDGREFVYRFLTPGQSVVCTFTNALIEPELEITKSNDSTGPQSPGDTVGYTVTVTNPSGVAVQNLEVIDVLPGGFSYVAGSTLINSVPAGDPVNTSGELTWNVGTLGAGDSVEVSYQALIGDNVGPAEYTNFATCRGVVGGFNDEIELDQLVLAQQILEVECGRALSIVGVGVSSSLSAGVGGDVLGASTGQVLGAMLPAAGSETVLLLVFLAMIATGVILKRVSRKVTKNV